MIQWAGWFRGVYTLESRLNIASVPARCATRQRRYVTRERERRSKGGREREGERERCARRRVFFAMRWVLGREWKAECGLLSSWMEIDSCWGCSCGSVHVFSSCGSLPRFLIHASTLFDPPRLLSSLSLSSLIPPFSSTRFLQNQSLKHYTLCIRVRENGSEKSIHVRITWFDPIVEKGKKKRKIVLNLLSQNSNEIPKKKKKKKNNKFVYYTKREDQRKPRSTFQNSCKIREKREKKKKITGRRWYSHAGQRLLAPREARRRRSKEGSRLSPKKEEEKKKPSNQKKKKINPTINQRSIDSTSNQTQRISLSVSLPWRKKKERKKGG